MSWPCCSLDDYTPLGNYETYREALQNLSPIVTCMGRIHKIPVCWIFPMKVPIIPYITMTPMLPLYSIFPMKVTIVPCITKIPIFPCITYLPNINCHCSLSYPVPLPSLYCLSSLAVEAQYDLPRVSYIKVNIVSPVGQVHIFDRAV